MFVLIVSDKIAGEGHDPAFPDHNLVFLYKYSSSISGTNKLQSGALGTDLEGGGERSMDNIYATRNGELRCGIYFGSVDLERVNGEVTQQTRSFAPARDPELSVPPTTAGEAAQD